ncbi:MULTISPECIES: dipeptidase PepE [Saccharopolyspora]|uniref:dipeptidase PepE n=1 Tax=Saccharopolyspora TaxID=1835 RepID=UPI001F202284|nr:dipeptidase PepE [Saccharopolyspora elongata]
MGKKADVELLLLSSSMKHGTGFLEHAMPAVTELLAGRGRLLFVPFAKRDHDGYTATVQAAVAPLGITVDGLHRADDPVAAVREAEAVFIGGGNTFRLLSTLHRLGLVTALREAVRGGTPYMGASAGTNMACPSLRTSNDMPIVEPPSFEAIGLVPFQINPHYLDPDPGSTHMGETREQRIAEFLEDNDVPVLGLREGAWLRVRGEHAELGGSTGARLFTRGAEPRELGPGDDATFLLRTEPHYDA